MQKEFDYYIPPNVTINTDGTIDDMSDVYEFHDQDQLFLYSFSGYGMPQIDYITQQGPYQHGETVLDYRLKPRIIQLVHKRIGGCRENYWDNRSDIINKLRPNMQFANSFGTGRLRKILPDESVRDLRVIIQSGPVFSPRNVDSWMEYDFQETIRFIAHNPILFNPSLESANWALSSFNNLIFYESPNWTNRAVFPIWFGGDVLSEILNITYSGTWLAYPTIIITGPLETPRIYNNTTNEKIQLDYAVSVGETVTINLEYGQKTVTNNFGSNLIGTISSDSDLASFHIAPYPEAPNGINEFEVVGGGAVLGQTEVRLTWNTNYIGI